MADNNNGENLIPFPRAELHYHLEGGIRIERLVELGKKKAAKLGIDVSNVTEDEWKQKYQLDRSGDTSANSLTTFIEKFASTQDLLDSYDVIKQITYDAIEDAYKAGIRLLELRYSPKFIQRGHEEALTLQGIHDAVSSSLQHAISIFPIATGLIGIIDRNCTLEEATEAMEFFIKNKKDFIAVDLANDELKYPRPPFEQLFKRARDAGLKVTIHAGESKDGSFADNVKYAIESFGAERIGHGVAIQYAPEIAQFVKDNNVTLEICIISNILTGCVANGKAHPIRKFFDDGIKVTISTDDMSIFASNLEDEYDILKNDLLFTPTQLSQLNINAKDASFIPKETIDKYWK